MVDGVAGFGAGAAGVEPMEVPGFTVEPEPDEPAPPMVPLAPEEPPDPPELPPLLTAMGTASCVLPTTVGSRTSCDSVASTGLPPGRERETLIVTVQRLGTVPL